MLLEITGKVLLDRNTMYSTIFQRTHSHWHYLLFLLLFSVYTITNYCYIVLLLSLYHPSNIGNMNINWIK